MGGGREWEVAGSGRWLQEVGGGKLHCPKYRWEMGGWPLKLVGDDRFAPKTGGRLEDETRSGSPRCLVPVTP